MSTPFDELTAVTDAIYQVDLNRLKTIAADEMRLRSELARLAETERHTALVDAGSTMALRQIGGDILWQAWVGRKREALNLQLATVMARKLTAVQRLRESFGKSTVTEGLRDRDRDRLRAKCVLRALYGEQSHMVLQAVRSSTN